VHDLPAQYDPALLEKIDPTLLQKLADSGFEVTGYRLEVLGHFKRS
jgi:Fur family ferric uptake transcriptional regulator/Fur family peroxide stress response transcriptional regulator